jgi:hypothetical protein
MLIGFATGKSSKVLEKPPRYEEPFIDFLR